MLLFQKAKDIHTYLTKMRAKGVTIGFCPTMGALHEGHISLVSTAQQHCDLVVSSIFVNPTQFNNAEDLAKYPKTLPADITMLEAGGCSALYVPEVADIYPDGTTLSKAYTFDGLDSIMEGVFRPGHFQGVAQVVDRLLDIVSCHQLFLGEKDLQQVAIITKMAQQYHPSVKIHTVPTMRETSGLAMSSRNRRLADSDRVAAADIYKELSYIRDHAGERTFEELSKEVLSRLEEKGFKTEYLSLLDLESFRLLDNFKPGGRSYLLIATHFGGVRLIDNIPLH